MEPYRVQLDVYRGPLDLLLYLIRRDEVDIYDIPIAHITEQYCRHVEMISQLDPNLAGEFLVMAATLLEIKTRMLLPTPAEAAEGGEEAALDPRADLVRQLLEYKAFKDAADELRHVGEAQALRHPRRPVRPEFEQPELDMADIQAWHLLEAFGKVMAAIGQHRASHEVIYDDTPISLHQEDLIDRLGRRQGRLRFQDVFAGCTRRLEAVGLFLAMLELIRQNRIRVQQEDVFSDIYIFLKDPDEPAPPADAMDQPGSDDTMIAFNESPAGKADRRPAPGRGHMTLDRRDGLDERPDALNEDEEVTAKQIEEAIETILPRLDAPRDWDDDELDELDDLEDDDLEDEDEDDDLEDEDDDLEDDEDLDLEDEDEDLDDELEEDIEEFDEDLEELEELEEDEEEDDDEDDAEPF